MPTHEVERRISMLVEAPLQGAQAFSLLDDVRRIPLSRFNELRLNLSRIQAVDVTGVAVLVRLHTQLQARGKRLCLTDVTEPVEATLRRLRLSDVLTVSRQGRAPGSVLVWERDTPAT